MYDLEFNGTTASSLGVKVSYRPDMPSPEKNIEEIAIPGRDGALIEWDGTYADIDIEVDMNFIISPDDWGYMFRQVKRWLSKTGNLRFSDDPEYFYKVKNITINTTERTVREAGEFTAVFRCDPYIYAKAGINEMNLSEAAYNPGAIAKPVYKIKGEGLCRLTVNGKTFSINVGQNATIDTDLMLAYRQDGKTMNADVTGDYANLWLQEGENTLSASANSTVTVIPNWRYI